MAPLVPAEVDLRDFDFMPLEVRRLRDSAIASAVSKNAGEEFRAAVLLWCAAWHQVPAASLPHDDVELASLAGYGRGVKEWRKVRDGALRGWVVCDDGRLYHPVVSEKAIEAWNSKLEHAWNRATDRLRKANHARKERSQPPLALPSFGEWNSVRIDGGFPPEFRWNDAQIPAEFLKPSDGVPSNSGLKVREGKVREGKGYIKTQHHPSSFLPDTGVPPLTPGKKERGRRLEKTWFLPQAWGQWALQERPGWTPEDVKACAATFLDYWISVPGRAGVKLDWQATWRNWVRHDNRTARRQTPNGKDARAAATAAIMGPDDGREDEHERDITAESKRVA